MSASRDPSDYAPTTHAIQRAKERDIEFEDVAATIAEGECRDAMGKHCWLFIKEFPWYDRPLGVIADTHAGDVITVQYRR